LQVKPSKRPSAREALSDSWFVDMEVTKLSSGDVKWTFELLRTYKAHFKLQQIAMCYYVTHLLETSETCAQKSMFVKLNRKKDGLLTRTDIIEGYNEIVG